MHHLHPAYTTTRCSHLNRLTPQQNARSFLQRRPALMGK
jgi:hypothetical protein